jgi:hypothetical protein
MLLNVKEANKVSHISHISEKIEAYYSDELRKIWQTYDRDWNGVYSKKNLEVSF